MNICRVVEVAVQKHRITEPAGNQTRNSCRCCRDFCPRTSYLACEVRDVEEKSIFKIHPFDRMHLPKPETRNITMSFSAVDRTSPPVSPRGVASTDAFPPARQPIDFQGQSSIAPACVNPYPAPSAASSYSALAVGDANIPLIDLEAIQSSSGAARTELIRGFGDGLKTVGFVAVKMSEALSALVPRVNSEMKSYYARSTEEKLKDWHNNFGQTGFSPQGLETAAGAKKADIKETYFIPPNFDRWPADADGFCETMSAYHIELTKVASQVMSLVCEYVGESTESVANSMDSGGNLIRLAYYPAPKDSDDPGAVWAAAHEDLNGITLLPTSEVPGLQLKSKEGEWLAVNAPQGYLIVNTGEQLQYKTAGEIQATRHQVLNPGGIYARQARYASIFFASWSDDFSLRPFDSCLQRVTADMPQAEEQEFLKLYPDVTVEEFRTSRLIEMGSIPNPSEELVRSLHGKGLLRKPQDKLVAQYPFLASAAEV